jgi:acetyl esterase
MALHKQCEEVLRWIKSGPSTPSVAEMRARERQRFEELAGVARPVAEWCEVVIPAASGDIGARLYRPYCDPGPGVLVWFHGGGFVMGSPELWDDQARALALASRCQLLSVDYRLAPEHQFPAAPEDCYAAACWVAEHADELGVPRHALAVGGDSAGGSLAAAVTLISRDRDLPQIHFQVLIYPTTCMNIDTPSRRQFADGYGLTLLRKDDGPAYLRSAADMRNPLASPLLAESHSGLPAALVITAEYDPLRDEGEMYAKALEDAGVPVDLRRYDGMIHGFCAYGGVIDEAWTAIEHAGHAVRAALELVPRAAKPRKSGHSSDQDAKRGPILPSVSRRDSAR